jgi:hypothetical protein
VYCRQQKHFSRNYQLLETISFSAHAIADRVNDLAGDTQCQLKETCEDVVVCLVAIDGSADVTDIDYFALFIRVVSEN